MDTTARATQVADQPARVAASVRQARRRRRPSGAPPPLPAAPRDHRCRVAAGRRRARRRVHDQLCRQPERRRRRGDRRRRPGRAVARRAAQTAGSPAGWRWRLSRQLAGLQDPRLVHRRPAAGVQAHSPSGGLRRRPRGDLAAHPGPVGRAQAAQAVRGRHRRELERLCAAVGPGRHPGREPGQRPLRAGARGPLAAGRQVGGDRDRRPGGPWARVALGLDAPTDVLLGAVIGVTIPLLAYRWFTPNEVFPISYRRGRSAHLDIGGARGEAIRRAVSRISSAWPSRRSSRSGWPGRPAPPRCGSRSRATRRWSCSASCTPAATCARTGGTSSAGSCCTAAWRTRRRSTPSAGWSSRRTTPCGCCATPACPRRRPTGSSSSPPSAST